MQHFTFGWGLGGFSLPQPNATTQKQVVAQVNTTTSYTGISLQYRRADTDSWTDIPTADVTYQSTGLGIGSWPVTATPEPTRLSSLTSSGTPPAPSAASTDPSNCAPASTRAAPTRTSPTPPSIPHIQLDQAAFGAGFASAAAGPGSVNLLTGNLEIDATDVSVPGGRVSRTFQSRAASGNRQSVRARLDLEHRRHSEFQSLTDNTDTVVVTQADGSQLDFGQTAYRAPTPRRQVQPT